MGSGTQDLKVEKDTVSSSKDPEDRMFWSRGMCPLKDSATTSTSTSCFLFELTG